MYALINVILKPTSKSYKSHYINNWAFARTLTSDQETDQRVQINKCTLITKLDAFIQILISLLISVMNFLSYIISDNQPDIIIITAIVPNII